MAYRDAPNGAERLSALMSDWMPIDSAPSDRDIEVSVIDRDGYHAFVFPVRRTPDGWVAPGVKGVIWIDPTHWREWTR